MSRRIITLVLFLSIAFAPGAMAIDYYTIPQLDDLGSINSDGAVVFDPDGNLHIVMTARVDPDVDNAGYGMEPQILYYMVEPDGDVLIADTWLTVGGDGKQDKNRPAVAWTDDDRLAVAYHQEKDDIHWTVLDPSAHNQDGTDANATATTPVAGGGNTGEGTMGEVWTCAAATATEDWTVSFDGAEWTVTGSVSGELTEKLLTSDGFYPVPPSEVQDEAAKVSFIITESGTPFADGDTFTFSTTASIIVDEFDAAPISEVDSTQSVAPSLGVMPSGDVFIIWREGGWEKNGTYGYRNWSASKALTDVGYWYDTGADRHFSGGYGARAQIVAGDGGVGLTFGQLYADLPDNDKPPDDDDDDLIDDEEEFGEVLYANIRPKDANENVAPSRVFISPGNGSIHHDVGQLSNGVTYVPVNPFGEDGKRDIILVGFDKKSAGFTGDPLVEDLTGVIGGSNTGDGTISDILLSLASPAAGWTLTVTDDSVPGAEVWSVSNDAKGLSYPDATTDEFYVSPYGDIAFTIEAGTTDFVDGDNFVFSSINDASVFEPVNLSEEGSTGTDDRNPYIFVHPGGEGIVLTYQEVDDSKSFSNHNYNYFFLGYDGTILSGPTRINETIGEKELLSWRYVAFAEIRDGKIYFVYGQEQLPDGYRFVKLAVTDVPEVAPKVTAVSPASGDEGTVTNVTITGENFEDGAAVFFDGETLSNVTFSSATELTADVPDTLAPGFYTARVVNPTSLFDTLTDAFEVIDIGDDDDDDSDDDNSDDDDSDDDDSGADDDDEVGGGGDDDDDDDGGCCG